MEEKAKGYSNKEIHQILNLQWKEWKTQKHISFWPTSPDGSGFMHVRLVGHNQVSFKFVS